MRLLFWTLLLFVMWMILTSHFEIANLLTGISVSFFVALLYSKMFRHQEFEIINPYWLGVYILVLIKNLIISNLEIAKRTLSKDMQLSPAIVEVKTELKSKWKKLLLANSITLTPGTLTLDVKGDKLYIHIIECRDIQKKQLITKEFEDIIAKI